MKLNTYKAIGIAIIAIGFIPAFLTKDLGITTICSAIGVYLIKKNSTQEA